MSDGSQLSTVQVLLLLALWDLSQSEFKGAKVPKTAVRNRVSKAKSSDFNALLDLLGLVQADGKEDRKDCVCLTPAGEAALGAALADAGFEFATNTGAKTVNALLRWIRVMGSATVAAPAAAQIESYEAFKAEVLEIFERLNKGYNYAGLVPIWHIRREIGDQVDRLQFNDWMLEIQGDKLLYLQPSDFTEPASDEERDSIYNEIRGLLFFASKNS